MKTLLDALFWVYLLLLSLSLVYGIVHRKKLSTATRFLLSIIGLSLLGEIVGEILVRLIGTNFPVYHILTLGLIILYFSTYKHFWKSIDAKKSVNPIVGISLVFISLIFLLFSDDGLMTFPSFSSSILSISVVILSLISFYKQLKNPILTPLAKQPLFWFDTGNFIFYTVTFFVFGYYQYFTSNELALPGWMPFLLVIGNVLLYGSYFAALYVDIKENKGNVDTSEKL